MPSQLRMDRSVAERATPDQQGKDVGVLHAPPADRILTVLSLTLMAREFKEPNVVQPNPDFKDMLSASSGAGIDFLLVDAYALASASLSPGHG